MSSIKKSQANSNPQVIDCSGKQCGKCGSPLQPKSLPSGGGGCACPNCDKAVMASKDEPCLSCHSKKVKGRVGGYKVGDKLKGNRTKNVYSIVDIEMNDPDDIRFLVLDNGNKVSPADVGNNLNYRYTRLSSKIAQMEKDVPVTVKPVDVGAPPVTPDKNLDKVDPIGEGGDVVPPEEPAAPPVDDGRDRITKLLRDVEGLQSSIKEYLESSYKISLTEDELGELVTKILSAIASYVATTTTDRVTELAGDILNIPYEESKRGK